MKRVDLQVEVTYTVSMEVDISDEVFDGLESIQKTYPYGINNDDMHFAAGDDSLAIEWLENHCSENDAMAWCFEIEDLTEID